MTDERIRERARIFWESDTSKDLDEIDTCAAFALSERDAAMKDLLPQNPEQLCALCGWKLNDRNIRMAQKVLDVFRSRVAAQGEK